MKKMIALLIAVVVTVSVFCSCAGPQSTATETPQPQISENVGGVGTVAPNVAYEETVTVGIALGA